MPESITFPNLAPRWLFDRDCVLFVAAVEGEPVRCLITMEALIQHFGARGPSSDESLRSFVEHRARIEELARGKILAGEFDVPGEVVIKMADHSTKPKPNSRLEWRRSEEIDREPELSALIDTVGYVLAENLTPESGRVLAEFAVVHPEGLLQVTVKDPGTDCTAVDWLAVSRLRQKEYVRRRLARLWAEFLRLRSARPVTSSTA